MPISEISIIFAEDADIAIETLSGDMEISDSFNPGVIEEIAGVLNYSEKEIRV